MLPSCCLTGYGSLLLQGAEFDAFVKVAQKNEDATFLQTKDKDIAKEAGLTAAGAAVITNFDGESSTTGAKCGHCYWVVPTSLPSQRERESLLLCT